jgi:TRAP-type mannitol/chloroaromatic compound transport system permease small subunit
MKAILKAVDAVSSWTGKCVQWLSVALILVMTFEVIMRYVFDSPTLWAFETSIMLGATMYVLGWAYAHLHRLHLRVDVFYVRLSPRGKSLIDALGTLFLAFPILTVMIINSFNYAVIAWKTKERLDLTIWYPPAGPMRTVIVIGFILLTLQCLAGLARDLYMVVRSKPYDS